jgi:hypothetical protein
VDGSRDVRRSVPPGLTPAVRGDWAALGEPTPAPAVFEQAAVADLPEPVGRWLSHAIAEGTPLHRAVQLRMHGEIRLGGWSRFTAVQRSSVSGGFVWAATARVRGLPVVGFDRWTRGAGEMRWRLLGALPVQSAEGEDVTRSAAGRHAGELLLAMPGAALSPEVSWRSIGADRAVAALQLGGIRHEVTLTVAADGALGEVVMRRWGEAGSGSFAEQPFGATLHGEITVDGVTVPRRITAGWHYGTDRWAEGQFIRYMLDDVRRW